MLLSKTQEKKAAKSQAVPQNITTSVQDGSFQMSGTDYFGKMALCPGVLGCLKDSDKTFSFCTHRTEGFS